MSANVIRPLVSTASSHFPLSGLRFHADRTAVSAVIERVRCASTFLLDKRRKNK
jgi:hypothetical protein